MHLELYALLARERMDRALSEARRDWLAHQAAGQSPSGWTTLARFLNRVARAFLLGTPLGSRANQETANWTGRGD
jgi:hypothetical protein